jgi:sigma-B regulation protein RsbU (phosphoserine phosphatase)
VDSFSWGQFEKRLQISVTSETSNIAKLRNVVEAVAVQTGFGEAEVAEIKLAIDEGVTNIIRHGYDGRGGQPIDLTIELIVREGCKGLQFTLDDCGRQVDPETIVGRDLHDIRPGGLGTHILNTVMDEVEYVHREPVGMSLRLVKILKSSGSDACGTNSADRKESSDG